MNNLIMRIKPIYGITFHAGDGGDRGKVMWTHRSIDTGRDDIAVTAAPEHRHARWIAEQVLMPAIISSRNAGNVLCEVDNFPGACAGSNYNGSFGSAVSPQRNRTTWAYAATGMLDFLIETHEGPELDTAFRKSYFYEESPILDARQQKNFDNGVEYARNYTDGMVGLLNHALCPNSEGTGSLRVTGTVVDERGNPLEATIRFLEMDKEVIAGYSHLHADYIDTDDDGQVDHPDYCTGVKTDDMKDCSFYNAGNRPDNPLIGTDYSPRKADKKYGRFHRMISPVGAFNLDNHSIVITHPGKEPYTETINKPSIGDCAIDIGKISLISALSQPEPEPEPITDCSLEPRLLSPAAGSEFSGDEVELEWESNGCHFWARAGSRPNTSDYLNKSLAGANHVTLSGLPHDGSDVHFKLLYRNTNLGGPWLSSSYQFTAPLDTQCESPPFIQSPQEGDTLAQGSTEFDIVTNGCVVWPEVGSRPRSDNYASIPEIQNDQDDFEVSGYPSDESDLFVTLFYATEYDALVSNVVYQYKTPNDTLCTLPPTLTSHSASSVLEAGGDTIEWTSHGCHYWVYAGNAPGDARYHNQSMAGATSVSISNYPNDGSDVHFTLLYRNTNLGGPWQSEGFVLKTE
ncbi:MAG: hypothetical protein V3U76_15275 [Granulosicoccus sp.]